MGYKHANWRWKNVLLSLVLLMTPVVMCAIKQKEEVRIDGMSLIGASRRGPRNIVNYLMKKGPYVDAADKDGNTALIEASRNGNKKVVDRLIRGGADINAVNNYDYTALMGASNNNNKEVVNSLIKGGANINAVSRYGNTALMGASRSGHKEVVDNLIKAGANPYIKNSKRKNTLDVAGDFAGNKEDLKEHIIKKRNEYVIKKYKEYLIDGKNRMENLAASLQKEYDWYNSYWNEDKSEHDEHNLQEVKQSYSFPKDLAGVIARMRYEISDDEWAQILRLKSEQQ